jgi:hypothetical protein
MARASSLRVELPNSVRYVKNGKQGQWWGAARANRQVHLGWKPVPKELLLKPDFPRIKQVLKSPVQDFNALQTLLDSPSKHVWITFEEGSMWWCTVLDGANVNPDGESDSKGNFWLVCDRPWTNRSLTGELLSRADLPGIVTTVAGFKGTVCTPKARPQILRVIKGQKDPDVVKAAAARKKYKRAVEKLVTRLTWQDFEQLIDLILNRTGWARISTLGGPLQGIDLEVENRATDENRFRTGESRCVAESAKRLCGALQSSAGPVQPYDLCGPFAKGRAQSSRRSVSTAVGVWPGGRPCGSRWFRRVGRKQTCLTGGTADGGQPLSAKRANL